jgi:hypothetical protein
MPNRLHRVKLMACPIVVFLALALSGARAMAQSASFDGVVTDPTNAAVPKASVELLQPSTQTRQTTVTNGAGFYSIPNVMPGEFTITVSAPGFKTETRTNVAVDVGAKISLNFSLTVGSPVEQVSVNGSGVEIDTTDASVSTVIERNFVENLPLNGRSFQSLITLSPGVIVVRRAA